MIIKAQVHTGGRGKGHFRSGLQGGVHVVNTAETVEKLAKQMIGYKLFTKQTGAEGKICNQVLINEGVNIDKEYYFAILLDRSTGGPVMVASAEGGMEIEDVAAKSPEKIYKEQIDCVKGMSKDQAVAMAKKIGIKGNDQIEQASTQMLRLYKLFKENDATQVEINPFAYAYVPGFEKKYYCIDAKLNFDDDAKFRHKELHAMRDLTQEDPRDVTASKLGVNFVGLDGSIGCMVNGAGLAMSTMDIIKLYGGSPANFLDVGGSATKDQVSKSLEVITSDKRVKAILINIFGGIMRCDIIANGISQALDELHKDPNFKIPPLVVRLEGTNVKLGKEILAKTPYKLELACDLDDAARRVTKYAHD